MSELITPQEFERSDGVADWRVVASAASARFRTGSFTAGVELVVAIGALADAADSHADVDLRPAAVTVRLPMRDVPGLSERDVELARQISTAARELELPADAAAVQDVHLTIDAVNRPAVLPFWRAVLGYEQVGDEDLVDPCGASPAIWFQPMSGPRPQRNRIHVDVWVPHDQAEARVAAALASGGHLVSDEYAPAWWTLADAEGNEVDVATWMGRD
ncbi:MAG TPA: VOC family protein [Kineosporiaceae bacterium]|nr:VOC family protein [Kineosporiaceae bacterium]